MNMSYLTLQTYVEHNVNTQYTERMKKMNEEC